MGDIIISNSRLKRPSIFKLVGGVEHTTCHVWPLSNVKRSKVKVTR